MKANLVGFVLVVWTATVAAQSNAFAQTQEPPPFEQATGRTSLTLFGPWAEYGPTTSPGHGDVLLYRFHVVDMVKAEETKVIDFHYPYAGLLNAYRAEGATDRIADYIERKNPAASADIHAHRNFVYAGVWAGAGKGISLTKRDGKFHLWDRSPAAFGNDYDIAGVLVHNGSYCLFARNRDDKSVVVFLSTNEAERHYEDGRVETLTASSGDIILLWLPQILLGLGALVAVVAVGLVLKRRLRGRARRVAGGAAIFLCLMSMVACGGAGQELKVAVREQAPDGSRILVVFWEPGFGTPGESGAATLILDTGATCTTPRGFPDSVKSDNKQTGKRLCARFFAAPPAGSPTHVEIGGSKRAVRWATETEKMEFTSEMAPSIR